MSDKDSSTAKSYLDSAIAQGQSALGSLTGSTGDKVSPIHLNTRKILFRYGLKEMSPMIQQGIQVPLRNANDCFSRQKLPRAKTKLPLKRNHLTPSAN